MNYNWKLCDESFVIRDSWGMIAGAYIIPFTVFDLRDNLKYLFRTYFRNRAAKSMPLANDATHAHSTHTHTDRSVIVAI